MTPSYVIEFCRWRDAPLDRREGIIREQASMRLVTPDFRCCPSDMLFEVLMPNGKRFGSFVQNRDLMEMGEWYIALGERMIFEARRKRRAAS